MKWEYRSEGCGVSEYHDSFVELYAKPLGEKGWELMHIVEFRTPCPDQAVEGQTTIRYPDEIFLKGYFKREIPDSD